MHENKPLNHWGDSMLTSTQIKTAQSILNIFETGEVCGDYGNVTVINGDTGHLTFGRSQTTLGAGGLFELLQRYCNNSGARFTSRLRPYLARLEAKDLTLDNDLKLHNILRATADDPVMRDTQDLFFDQEYWQPAARAAQAFGITCALGFAIVYDGYVQGAWAKMRDRTIQEEGNFITLGEQDWLSAYVKVRRAWLAASNRPDLPHTVYRMDSFQRLIDQGYWGLELPLVVRDVEISLASLAATPRGCYDGPHPGSRSLSLESPMLRGLDVRLVQLALSGFGADIKADGIYGKTSVKRVKEYQIQSGLPVTGVADIPLITVLCSH
jgi:chitosanase